MVSSGPTTTSVLRSWRKKDASEKQPPTTSSSTEPSSGNVSENQGPVARVAPHNHYPKASQPDIYRYPQQHGEYGVQSVPQLSAPVKYSEIIEPMQSIEQIPPILPKPKEKTYLEMCNVQQNHMKPPYQDYQNYKQHYDGLKTYNHMPTYKQQYHPYLQKESQMPGYVQKEANIPPQYLPNYKMPSNYPRNYPREGNEFLANLNKIAPDMAQDIINDPHLRDPHLREPQFPMYPPPPSIDQNRLYQQQHQRMYQKTSPIQHGVQNYGQRHIPQNYNQYQMNQQRMPPSDPYRMYPPHQRYGQVEPQMPTNISPRQYHENMMGFPTRISPNYPSCGQLEYAQHYQHRQVPMRQEFLPIPNKPYIESHPEIPEIVPDESIHQPKKTLKAYLENWREEFTEDAESADTIATDKIQMVKSSVPNRENTLYVLDAMDIPSENIPQYLHLQPIEKLPPNIRTFNYNAEENVRQNAIVISTNVKNDELNKNVTKDNGNTYQLFQNKTDGNADGLVYQTNTTINPYKNEEISSHEDRPACKLLQSMVKARNANANERPLEKLDMNNSDKDKFLHSCFQEPSKEVCRSLPQLIHEEAEELNKNNEEHLENEYSKIVDSILEENTQNVPIVPVIQIEERASEKKDEKNESVKEEGNRLITTNNVNDNSSINFTENLIKTLEVVERKSVIAENTLPHVVTENQPKNTEFQNSYGYFPIAKEHTENSTTRNIINVKSKEEEEDEKVIAKVTNVDLEDKNQLKDLSVLQDPIDLSHHLELMNPTEEINMEVCDKRNEDAQENTTNSTEQEHIHADMFEYKNVKDLEKQSNDDSIDKTKTKEVVLEIIPDRAACGLKYPEIKENVIEESEMATSEIQEQSKRINEEEILNIEDRNEEIHTETPKNEDNKRRHSQDHNNKNYIHKDITEENESSKLQVSVNDSDFEQENEENNSDDSETSIPQIINTTENEVLAVDCKEHVQIHNEDILQSDDEITSKDEIEIIESEEVVFEEIVHEDTENYEESKDEIYTVDETTDSSTQDECHDSSRDTRIKMEYDTEVNIDNVEETQLNIDNDEISNCDVKAEEIEESNSIDNTTSDAVNEKNHEVNETVKDNSNQDTTDTTVCDKEECSKDNNGSEANEETDKEDDENYSDEAVKYIPLTTDQDHKIITSKKEDDDDDETNENDEVCPSENTHFEENIDESETAECITDEIEVFQDNLEEVASNIEISNEILEDSDEIRTPSPITCLDDKEENNNEIFDEQISKNDDDINEVCKNQKPDDENEELSKEQSTVVEISDESKLKEINSIHLRETKQNNIAERTTTKEEIGSSFVLEIAKELLQINVTENSNGEKIIAITPLTKVKVITPTENVRKENADMQEEIPTKILSNDVTNNEDQSKNQEEEEEKEEEEETNESSSAVEEMEINQDTTVSFEGQIEEISETIISTEEIQEGPEQRVIITGEIEEEARRGEEETHIIVDNLEENPDNLSYIDGIDHPPDTIEIIEETEILVETCNEVETVKLNMENYQNDQEIIQGDIIPGNDLDLHNEIIIETKDELSDEILLENAQTVVITTQTEEILKDDEDKKKEQEERAVNNNYMEQTPYIDPHKSNNEEQVHKTKEKASKPRLLGNTNKKVLKSRRSKEKKMDNKTSQLNALRNFRKNKNRNALNSELNQQKKLAYLNSKKKKGDLSSIGKFDSVERAKIFSSIVVIDKIPLETIIKVTERNQNAEREKKLKEKYKKVIKRHTGKMKLNDNKLSKEYKIIKTKFKRQREIARDIKRFMQKQKSSNIIDKKDNKTYTKKEDNSIRTSIENVDVKDKLKIKNDNDIELINKDIQNVSSSVSLEKASLQQSDNDSSNVLTTTSNKLTADSNKSVGEIISNDAHSFEILQPKPEETKLISKEKEKLSMSENSVSTTQTIQSAVTNEIPEAVHNTPTISPRTQPKHHSIHAKHTGILSTASTQLPHHNFQVPMAKNIQNLNRKHPKELRRTKSDNHFNSDFLHNFKKRRLSLEEYNNRKRNLNKLAQKKIEDENKPHTSTSDAADENKEKQKMVDEVLQSLKCEEMEIEHTKIDSSKEISLQNDSNLKISKESQESSSPSIKDVNTTGEQILNKNIEPSGEKTLNENIPNTIIPETIVIVEEDSSNCEPVVPINVVEDQNPENIKQNENEKSPIANDFEPSKGANKNIGTVESEINFKSKSSTQEIEVNSDKTPTEANTSKYQIIEAEDTSFEISKREDNSKKSFEIYSKPKEYFDKSSIEEKLNSLEEFLPKIAPKDPASIEISRKLEELLEENPITYDQKHYEMLLIRRFLNREILTPEELKRVRQIVQYKRAFQNMKNSTVTDTPKRRYSSEFSKSIKIDFNDFNLKKIDPAPAVEKEKPAQRRICYNRSISAFVEVESRKNQMKNRRNSARTVSESRTDRLSKDITDRIINRQSEFIKQSTQDITDNSISIKSSVIVENTARNKMLQVPNCYKENSTSFLKSVSEDIGESSGIISFDSSPKSNTITNNHIIETNQEECKSLKSESTVEIIDVDEKDLTLKKYTNTSPIETNEKHSEIDKHSYVTPQNIANIDNETIEIDITKEVNLKNTFVKEDENEIKPSNDHPSIPLTFLEDKSKMEYAELKNQDYVKEEAVNFQVGITKSSSSTENINKSLSKTPCSSNYIKHNILSIISKDNEKQIAPALYSPTRNWQTVSENISPPQPIKHAIQNLISHSSPKKYSNIPQQEQVFNILTSHQKNNKYEIPENNPKCTLNKDQSISHIKSAEISIAKNPAKCSKIKFEEKRSITDVKSGEMSVVSNPAKYLKTKFEEKQSITDVKSTEISVVKSPAKDLKTKLEEKQSITYIKSAEVSIVKSPGKVLNTKFEDEQSIAGVKSAEMAIVKTPAKDLNTKFEEKQLNIDIKYAEKSITESPTIDLNARSEENIPKSSDLEVSKITSPKSKETKYSGPCRISTSSQFVHEIIVNPAISSSSKIDKPSQTSNTKEKLIHSAIIPLKNTKEVSQYKFMEEKQKKIFNLEGVSSVEYEKNSNRMVTCEVKKKRNFEQSPVRKSFDVNKEKSSKIKRLEKNQQEIANLEKSVSNLTIDKDSKKYPKIIKEDIQEENTNLGKPTSTSVFTMREHEIHSESSAPIRIGNLPGNANSNKNETKANLEKLPFPERKFRESPKKICTEKNIKNSEPAPAGTKQIIMSRECFPSSSGSKQSCSSSKTKASMTEASCQDSPNKLISKTKAQLKSFQDSIDTKPKKEDDKNPNNINISPVISSITKLTALLTYYKKGLESGADTANLKKIKEIIDKVSPNLKNLPSVPDVNTPNEYAVSKPENPKLKLHLKKVHGENKKKKKRFRNLYTENDSEEDGGSAEPKAKEPKMDGNVIDYSVYQRKSPAGVPKLVIKRRKSDFKSALQPYVKINRIMSLESMVKKRKRTILVNQVFVDT